MFYNSKVSSTKQNFYNTTEILKWCSKLSLERYLNWKTTRNATPCNNFNYYDLLHLSFVLKFSLFSGAASELSKASMIEFFCKNNKLLTIFAKKCFIIDVRLSYKYASACTWKLFKVFLLKYFILSIHQTADKYLIVKPSLTKERLLTTC